jgi:hypothetical protein
MPQGALMQLIANTDTGGVGRVDDVCSNTAALLGNFGQAVTLPVPRYGDELMETYLEARVGALPAGCGWRWIDHMPHRLLERHELEIGGQRIKEVTGAAAAAWCVSHTPRDESMYAPAADGSYRFLLPLDSVPIPMVALGFHEVRYKLETAPFSELVVQDPTVAEEARAPLAQVEAAVQKSFTLRHRFRLHDTDVRRKMAQGSHELIFKAVQSDTVYPQLPTDRVVQLYLETHVCATGSYVHVLDEHGNELPSSCVERVIVKLNEYDRHNVTGLEARTAMRHQMTCKPRDDIKSANIYFLPYGTGQIRPDKREEGIQMGRIDNTMMELVFKPGTPEKVRVTVAHRYTQILRIQTGMGGIQWSDHHTVGCVTSVWKGSQKVEPVFGTELTGGIPLLEGDTCPISYNELAVGADVCMCGNCKKVYEAENMRKWISSQKNDRSCPACRSKLTEANFFYGKGRAGAEEERLPAAVRPTTPAAAAEGEGVGLLAGHDIFVGPARPPRLFTRVWNGLFGPQHAVHPHAA